MPIVSHSQILRVHAAALAAGLTTSRNELLAGIPQSLVAVFPRAENASAQVLSDLDHLNDSGWLPDGSVPLQTWLLNALALCGPRKEADIFQEVLGLAEGSRTSSGASQVAPATAWAPAAPFASASQPVPTNQPAADPSALASVYLSYVDDDLPFARRLYEALEAAGAPVFFRHEHAVPGAHRHRSARRSIREYEHVILLCSERSLRAASVVSELDEMLSREFDDGASERIIPVLLDDFASTGWQPRHPDIRQAVLDRVPLDMKGADGDRTKFDKAMKRLLWALKG